MSSSEGSDCSYKLLLSQWKLSTELWAACRNCFDSSEELSKSIRSFKSTGLAVCDVFRESKFSFERLGSTGVSNAL